MIINAKSWGCWTKPYKHGKPIDMPIYEFNTETREATVWNYDGDGTHTIIDHDIQFVIWNPRAFEAFFPKEFRQFIDDPVFFGFE